MRRAEAECPWPWDKVMQRSSVGVVLKSSSDREEACDSDTWSWGGGG